jgi:hypothetical protein
MLHVMPEVAKAHPSSVRACAYAERMFQEILAGIGPEEHRPTCTIKKGQVVETILRVASAGHFDLIVLGAVSGSSSAGRSCQDPPMELSAVCHALFSCLRKYLTEVQL